jgi:diadenosine tetraphosphate (Ap4A) HIT family hydrolase
MGRTGFPGRHELCARRERLAKDTLFLGDMRLSRVLLMNDARWPWLILVPRREGAVELTDLDADDRGLLIEEAASAARVLKAHTSALKINLGMLGNVVRQLHLHVVARNVGDPPGPARSGGTEPRRPTAGQRRRRLIAAAQSGFGI